MNLAHNNFYSIYISTFIHINIMSAFSDRPNRLPDSGVDGVRAYKSGPSAGARGPPSVSELLRPNLVTTKISLDTNVTTSVPIMIRPWLDKYEKQFVQGSILFSHCDTQAHRLATVADLPTMNYLLENNFHQSFSNAGVDKSSIYVENYDEFVSVNGWNMFGILRNDMMAESNLQKLLNCDVFGRAMVGNIFGRLKRGDHVGLAIIKLELDKMGELHSNFVLPSGQLLPGSVVRRTNEILQIVPTVNRKITIDVLSDKAPNKNYEQVGEIPLGVVSHAVAKMPSDGLRRRALRSQQHHILLPLVEILMI